MAGVSLAMIHPHGMGGSQQRCFRWIAHPNIVLTRASVIAKQTCQEGFFHRQVGVIKPAARCRRLTVPRPELLESKELATGVEVAHRHPVLGEGACFVGTDHRGAAQCFHCRQLADDRLAARHALHTNRQGDRHDGG